MTEAVAMKRMKTLSKASPVEMAAPRRPRGLSLQAIVVAIVGLMLVVLQLAIGVTDTLVRLSVGCEDAEDIIADFRRAMDAAGIA